MYLTSLKAPEIKASAISNFNIGVIDCETYITNNDEFKIYCLGFIINLSSDPVTHYIYKYNLSSDLLILELINELLRPV